MNYQSEGKKQVINCVQNMFQQSCWFIKDFEKFMHQIWYRLNLKHGQAFTQTYVNTHFIKHKKNNIFFLYFVALSAY